MKKKTYLRRILSLALMLTMLCSLAAVGVSAHWLDDEEYKPMYIETIFQPVFDDPCIVYEWDYFMENASDGLIVKTSDFDTFIQPFTGDDRDITLELAGVKLADYDEDWDDVVRANEDNADSVEIPPYPINGTEQEKQNWYNKYMYESIIVNYVAHRHNLQGSQMYFDDNYHWQLCTECGNRVYLANHTDKDKDGKCDFCGNAIRYYNVTVKDVTGGKVTLSANKGAMNEKITVTVTPDAGFHLEALNFVNANALHSKRAVWEDTPNAEYHFFISNWDVEVEAIFVKD